MKTIYKRKWREDAVSPVIATILMVAITVVLAAVLYLLVSGLIGGGTTTEPNINIESPGTPEPGGEWVLEIASVSAAESLGSYKVSVLNGSTSAISATALDTVKASGASGDGLTLAFSDATADDKLNAGDWFTLDGTADDNNYQVVIYWGASGNKVSGNTGKITT